MSLLSKLFTKKEDGDFAVDPNGLTRKKQILLLSIAAGGIMFVAFYLNTAKKASSQEVASSYQSADSARLSRDAVQVDFEAATKNRLNDRDIWMSSGVKKIEELQVRQKELEDRLAQQDETKKELESKVDQSAQAVAKDLNEEIAMLKKMVEEMKIENEKLKVSPPVNQTVDTTVVQDAVKTPIVVQNRFYKPEDFSSPSNAEQVFETSGLFNQGSGAPSPQPTFVAEPRKPSSNTLRSVSYVDESIQEAPPPSTASPSKVRTVDNYTPAGTFFKSILLGGVDAPTGGQAQQNPHPVFLMVDDLAFLPNRYKFDLRECRVIGHSYGDLNSERAMIRLETLSCVNGEGRVFEKRVKGHVFGEDGKAGLRGRVVEKTGQLLMRGLIAGVASGIGTAFQQQAMTYSTSALGSTSIVNPDQVGAAGLGAGVGKGLEQLSKYYIDLAEKLFPVIEIGSQRVVDIVLVEGIDWLEEDASSSDVVDNAQQRTAGLVSQAIQTAGVNAQSPQPVR